MKKTTDDKIKYGNYRALTVRAVAIEAARNLYQLEFNGTPRESEVLCETFENGIASFLIKMSLNQRYFITIDINKMNVSADHFVRYKTTSCM